MKKDLPEKIIQSNILNYLKIKGIFAWRNQSTGLWDASKKLYRKARSIHSLNGTSDVLGVLPDGKFLAIEVKSRTGRATDDQNRFMKMINAMGGVAFIARSIEDVEINLKRYFVKESASEESSNKI